MCGRYQLVIPFRRLIEIYGLAEPDSDPVIGLPVYNVAPTHQIPVVLDDRDQTVVREMRWGFPPMWVAKDGKDPWKGRPLINLRCETALRKQTWSEPLRQRRCLIPCTGFYEWMSRDGRKFPVWFRPSRTDVLSMAGVWSEFDAGEGRRSCVSVLTISANNRVAAVHNRMPVFVPLHERKRWLGPLADREIESFFRTAPDGILSVEPVSTRLGKRGEEGPDLLQADWSLDD